MNKNSTLALLVCFVALLAGYYILGSNYFTARAENRSLYQDITTAMTGIAALPPVDTTIEERMEQALLDHEETLSLLPEVAGTTGTIDLLLKEAANHGLTAIPLRTEPWLTLNQDNQETLDIAVFRLTVRVSGNYGNLQKFLSVLGASMNNLVYEDISVQPENDETNNAMVTADVSIACYAYSVETESE